MPTGPRLDTTVSGDLTSVPGQLASPLLTTDEPGELLLALVSVDGPASPKQRVIGISGGGLTLTPGGYHAAITVAAFHGAGQDVAAALAAVGRTNHPQVTLRLRCRAVWSGQSDTTLERRPHGRRIQAKFSFRLHRERLLGALVARPVARPATSPAPCRSFRRHARLLIRTGGSWRWPG
jgi:hypothetical protein